MQVDTPQIDDNDELTAAERQEMDADKASDGAPTGEQDRVSQAAASQAAAAAPAAAAAGEDATAAALAQLAASQAATAASLASVAQALPRAADPPDAAAEAAAAEAAAAAAKAQEPDWEAERKALKAKFDADDLDDDEYETEREKLMERRAEWRADQRAHQVVEQRLQQERDAAAARAKQASDAQWDTSLAAFMGEGTNAAMLAKRAHMTVFNEELADLAAKNPEFTFTQLLNKAGEAVRKEFNLEAAGMTEQERIAKATDERRNVKAPPDLSRAPAAGTGDAAGDEFAAMDGLGIDDLENQLAHWSDEKIDRYLETAPGGLQDNPRG